jgi:outer membrane receptor protein involved in Fe transport
MGVAWLCWAVAAGASALPPAAVPPPDPPDRRETIVVTGERVKRSLKDTTSSVAVFDRRDLERMAAPDRMQDVLQFVPNVLIGSKRDMPIIRGQNSAGVLGGLPAFLGGARPRTVVQVDGRTITFNEFAFSPEGLWDVDRVEVFRSPQTTTQGVNSIAGAIFIHTTDPSYRLEGRARVIAGQLHRRQASAALSVPLIDDQLAIRVSGDLYRARTSNELSGPVAGVDLNRDVYGTARVKLLAEPRALPGLRLLLTYAHVESEAPQVELARRPFSERRDPAYIFGDFKVNIDSLTGSLSFPVGPSLESRTTASAGDTSAQRRAPRGFGQTKSHGRDGSVESLLAWNPEGRLSAIGGVSWSAMDLDQFIDLSVTPFGIGTFDDRQRSRALFGEAAWRATNRLSLTAGMRLQSDSKKRAGVLRASPDLPVDIERTARAFLPKVSAAYDVTPDVRVGAMVQRAYNPGGVTLDPGRHIIVQFAPEYLWDYESFVRAALLGGALNLNGNLFYNDIKDAQRTLDVCFPTPTGCVGLSGIANAPRAHSYGAELELGYKPAANLTLRGVGGFLRTKLTKTLLPTDEILGKEFAGAPRFTGTAGVDWAPVRSVSLSAQVRHSSGYFGDDAETPDFRIAPVTTVDARVSWQRRRFTMFAYAQNLFDKFHIIGWSDLRDRPNVDATTNDAREIGVGLDGRF